MRQPQWGTSNETILTRQSQLDSLNMILSLGGAVPNSHQVWAKVVFDILIEQL